MTQKNVFDDPFDYAEMVESLFKKDDSRNTMLMHAAIGVCGEAIEFEAAVMELNLENTLEELGDMTFYIQKILNMFNLHILETANDNAAPYLEAFNANYGEDAKRFPTVVDRIVYRSGELLDLCKKIWVYEDESKIPAAVSSLLAVMAHVLDFVEAHPIVGDMPTIKQSNREKLRKRYPQGVFTSKDAQERKDKI